MKADIEELESLRDTYITKNQEQVTMATYLNVKVKHVVFPDF